MKKAFIALMSTFIGLFGYTIVDEALEARVANLENSVSSQAVVIDSQQDEIESLHFLGKYSTTASKPTTTRRVPTTVTPSSDEPSENTTFFQTTIPVPTSAEYWQGKVFRPAYEIQTKYMYRVYENGNIESVPTGIIYPTTTTTLQNTTNGETAPTNLGYEGAYKECFLYLDSYELKVTDAGTNTKDYSYYDQDYSLGTTEFETNYYVLKFNLTGHADKELNGKTANVNYMVSGNSFNLTQYFSDLDCVIDENGNFSITATAVISSNEFILNSLEEYGYGFYVSVY